MIKSIILSRSNTYEGHSYPKPLSRAPSAAGLCPAGDLHSSLTSIIFHLSSPYEYGIGWKLLLCFGGILSQFAGSFIMFIC